MVLWAHPSPQPKRHLDRFSRFAGRMSEYPYTLQWDAHLPPKLPLPTGESGPQLVHGSLSPPESSTQTASWSVPLSQGSLVWQTDRPTDHATRSVTIGPIYVRSTAMRPKKMTNRRLCCTNMFDRSRIRRQNVKTKIQSQSETAIASTNRL